jgi:hypothetical protein
LISLSTLIRTTSAVLLPPALCAASCCSIQKNTGR